MDTGISVLVPEENVCEESICGITVKSADKKVLRNLSIMGEELKRLKEDMERKANEYNAARAEYEHCANVVLPMEMFSMGVTEIKLLSGATISYTKKFFCQPNKNAEDKHIMATWLREHGGEMLIKEKASVDKAQIGRLQSAGIPYVEVDEINTNSLKAFLKDLLGEGDGISRIEISDIPECMHFTEMGVVTIKE